MTLPGREQLAVALILLSLAFAGPSQSNVPTITFHVQDYSTAQPIQGATISLTGAQSLSKQTDTNGAVNIAIQFGEYQITAGKAQCTQIGPQRFVVDETVPSNVIVKLQCSPSGSPPLESPSLQTDTTTYHQGQVLTWQSTGFAPGAYVQPCLASACGGIAQSDSTGSSSGEFVINVQLSGAQTFSIKNTNTGASAQVQITISS